MQLKQIINPLLASIFISACSTTTTPELKNETPAPVASAVYEKPSSLPGISYQLYVGDFRAEHLTEEKNGLYINRISISIDSVKRDQLFGHSVTAGNKRPFTGTVKKTGMDFTAEAKEPGNDKYDGVFNFTISANGQTLQGTWMANNQHLPVSKRSYSLKGTSFDYDPQAQRINVEDRVLLYPVSGNMGDTQEFVTADAAKINASIDSLTVVDVENMYKRDLEVMRNAIYARHGYSFKNRQMRHFFDTEVDWYIPRSTDVSKELTSLEKNNIGLLKRYESHAESYYDAFGR